MQRMRQQRGQCNRTSAAGRRVKDSVKRAVQSERCRPASRRQSEAGSAIGALRVRYSVIKRYSQCYNKRNGECDSECDSQCDDNSEHNIHQSSI